MASGLTWAIVIGWAAAGFAFWVDANRFSGWPIRWRSVPRMGGWGETIFLWLPLSLVGGPIWWLIMGVVRLRNR